MADGAPSSAGTGGRPRVVAGRYRLASVLGRGGMGTVWHAVDEMLHRDVAIKELRLPDDLDGEEREIQQQRTLREARTAARVAHENVITIHDVVEDGGIPWIVMELVHADSLADILKTRGTLTPVEAAEVGLKVLNALVAAEAKGVLHRDVKPANILVTVSGRVVLTDFGIALEAGGQTLTATGMLVGSPNFLAPERAQGLRPNLAADLWSLGLVMYMAVEGRNPFDRATMISTLNSIMLEEPDPPRRAGVLLPVIEGLLRKDPTQRLSANDLERLLQGIIRGDLTQAHMHALPTPAPPTHDSTERGSSAGSAGPQEAASASATFVVAPQGLGAPQDRNAGGPYGTTPLSPAHGASHDSGPRPHPAGPPDTPWATPQYGSYDTNPHATYQAAPPVRPSRKPMVLGVIALVIAVLAAAAVVAFVVLPEDDDKTRKASPTGGQSAPASGPASTPPSGTTGPSTPPTATGKTSGGIVPPSAASTGTARPSAIPGYTWTVDPAGFSLFVPTGWQRVQSGAQIDYKDPRGKTFLRIGVDNAGVHPLDNFRALDADFALKKQNYRRLQLGAYSTGMPGWEAAVWEFVWDGNPFNPQSGVLQPSHAIDLGVRTTKGGDFSIYVSAFEPDWSAAQAVFNTVVKDFREN